MIVLVVGKTRPKNWGLEKQVAFTITRIVANQSMYGDLVTPKPVNQHWIDIEVAATLDIRTMATMMMLGDRSPTEGLSDRGYPPVN